MNGTPMSAPPMTAMPVTAMPVTATQLTATPKIAAPEPVARICIDPAALERDLAKLVLTLVEFLRRLMETQAVRRLEAGTVSDAQAEALGVTLSRAQEAVLSLCARMDVAPEELNLDLGPLGRLM
jgi:hypothetical protein